jgi:hypothetical protein
MLFKFARIQFNAVDPLDNGLREEIASEQQGPEAMTLEEGPDGDRLADFWSTVESDIQKDPDWFRFSEEE